MKADVKHNIPRESTYHFRNKQHTTGDVQIEDIDHTDIQTDKRNAERDLQTYRPRKHTGSTHHPPSTITHLGLNYISTRHHNPNQMKKPAKSKHKGDSQYNTTHTRLYLGWSVGCLVGWLLGQLVGWFVV